jgi:hypothetical protein
MIKLNHLFPKPSLFAFIIKQIIANDNLPGNLVWENRKQKQSYKTGPFP